MKDFTSDMRAYLERELAALQSLDLEGINEATNAILSVRERGGTVYTMGNGGSAATASHMVCDFVKGASDALGGKKFQFECLSDNTPTVMAIANDMCYEDIFVHQLRGSLKPGDLVIGISGSGNSENVVRAMRYAKELEVPTIGVTGYSGGKVKEMADYRMHVDIDDMQIVEDIHMVLNHMLMRMVMRSE